MSETLKFGTDGKWAVKEGSALAYNDENGNFKPLPFTFDRSTSATRVNKEGLIEVVSNNEPRIDFLNDSKGALLLEPNRSNYVLYSETEGIIKGSNGWGGDAIVTQNYGTAPYNGNELKSTRVQFGGSNKQLRNVFSALTMIPTCSIWIKGITGETIKFGSNSNEGVFTLNGDWQYITQTGSSISTDRLVINTYSGTTARDIEIYAPQIEQGSYATSYIPTQGSIGTRVQEDSVTQILTNSVVGQTEGTIFYDINMDNINSNSQYVGVVSDGTSSNRIQFLNNSSQQWQLFISASTISNNISLTTSTSGVGRYKIAIAYESGNVAYYINGVQKGTSSETFTFSNLLHFDLGQRYDDNFFLDNSINEAKLYNTRLSNTELQALTKI